MSASRRDLSLQDRVEKPAVLPRQPTADRFVADPLQLPLSRRPKPGFPARDGSLLDPGNHRHFGLSDLKDGAADEFELVHAKRDNPKGIKFATEISLKGLDCGYAVRHIGRAMDLPAVLRALMAARGWSQDELAERLRTTQSNVSRWLNGREPRHSTAELIRQLAAEDGLLDELPAAAGQRLVPIMGYIGAGAEIDPDYEQVPPDGLDKVELPFPLPEEMIAFEVRGDSNLPRYDDRDIVVVRREQNRATDAMIGEFAAVRTAENRRFLKRLMPGPKRHTFNLESLNAPTIIAARIAWASGIFAVVPASQLRHIGRPKRAAASRLRSATSVPNAPGKS